MRCSALVLGLAALTAAVYRDEVGDIDFHYALVGLPQPDTTFFHRPRRDDKASLLYTLSDLGVLAAVNPTNGDVVWRHRLAEHNNHQQDEPGFLRAPEAEDWLVTASGSGIQTWSALSGRSIWRTELSGRVKDVEMLDLTTSSTKDVLALFDEDGVTVLRRLHGAQGSVVWEFRETTKDVPLQVSNDIAKVYVISLTCSGSLKVTSLETATGSRVEQWTVGAKGDVRAAQDVMFVGANSAAPVAAWVDRAMTKLSVNVIGTRTKQEFPLPAGVTSVHIHAPHLAQSQPHFLVHTQTSEDDPTNKAFVFHTDLKTGQVTQAYELPAFRGAGSYSTSCEGANVYFAQVGVEETLVVSSESHGILARLPHKPVDPVHAVSEVVKKAGGGGEFAVRSALVTRQDEWTLLRNSDRDWTRHEGLSGAVAAVWAEIPEREDLARALAEEAHTSLLSAYVHRLKRHVDDLCHLPAYMARFSERVLKSLKGSGKEEDKRQGLWRDGFGFNKVLVVATRRGRLYGLNSGDHGRVIWTRDTLPLGGERPLVVRGLVAEDERGTVAMYGSSGFYVSLDASTGNVTASVGGGGSSKPVSCTAAISGELLPIGPDGLPTSGLPEGWDPEQTVVLRSGEGEGEMLQGVKFRATGEGGAVARQVMWQFRMRPGLRMRTVATLPVDEAVASIGRVLGDRRVLYKYLNSNGFLVASADEAARTLSVQLLDGVSGQVLAAQLHRGADPSLPVSCTMAENWYACAFFGDYALDDKTGRAIKGHQLVVTDLYESSHPDSRGPLGEALNSSSLNPISDPTAGLTPHLPWAPSHALITSQPLRQLSVSRTRQGIATRQLIAYLPHAHSVIGLARPLIDPRRPVGRDPSAAEMEAEGLPRYAAGLELDPRAFLSHERDVLVGRASTTLLAAYGVDVFVSRVAPSGEFDILGRGFSKLSLLGTVLALLAGVLVLGPMVRRKQINLRWEANL
ncbi:hypothetical protein L249_0896 [Ophiocordyceps polyrhachis-furcata BCC 54312]|uniref:ER membrane protein complex subunit 1 n=1 Tax=Ophiocordyceps polyrhachis-furcata BCC 54312 TaxID=1330021 RepID=A0A367LEF7_9HYPO|nr:hypothetical protein L249_0896 [Ophiocordyceps polyrhachis-furcata BCC 54312]